MKRTGKYKVLNKEKDPRYSLDGSIMQYNRSSGFFCFNGAPLQPINDNEAVIMGLGRELGDIIQATNTIDGEKIFFNGYEMIKEK